MLLITTSDTGRILTIADVPGLAMAERLAEAESGRTGGMVLAMDEGEVMAAFTDGKRDPGPFYIVSPASQAEPRRGVQYGSGNTQTNIF